MVHFSKISVLLKLLLVLICVTLLFVVLSFLLSEYSKPLKVLNTTKEGKSSWLILSE